MILRLTWALICLAPCVALLFPPEMASAMLICVSAPMALLAVGLIALLGSDREAYYAALTAGYAYAGVAGLATYSGAIPGSVSPYVLMGLLAVLLMVFVSTADHVVARLDGLLSARRSG